MPSVDPQAEPGYCTHRPPSPGQRLCQCGHLRIELRYAAALAGVPDPADNPPPTLGTDDDGYATTPPGWSRVVCDQDGNVVAGWDDAGAFHQYAPTETILAALLETLETFHA